MDNFEAAAAIILLQEGPMSNDKLDPGGVTKFGISKRAYPNVDIAALTKDQALAIYRADYWDKCGCGQMPWSIALGLFDGAVNQGPATAATLLQSALSVPADGSIGPRTVAAVAALASAHQQEVFDRFMAYRAIHYATSPDFATFKSGWINRLFVIHRSALLNAPA